MASFHLDSSHHGPGLSVLRTPTSADMQSTALLEPPTVQPMAAATASLPMSQNWKQPKGPPKGNG